MDILILTKYRRKFIFQFPNSFGEKNESYHDIKYWDDNNFIKMTYYAPYTKAEIT